MMIKNYLLTAFRNLRKHVSYSIINILGLGTGVAVTLLLATWIFHELSYDQFHSKAERTFRVSMEYGFGGRTARVSVSPTALLPALQKNFAEVEAGVRIYNPSGYNPFIVKHEDKLFQEDKFYFADSTFFKVFDYKLIRGSQDHVLSEPRTVLLSEEMAIKYFGKEDPVGKTLHINGRTDYTVSGVIENAPTNSYLRYDFIGSFSSLPQATYENVWWSANYQTFVVLNEQAQLPLLQEKTNGLVKDALANELTNPGDYVVYNWTPLTDLHLRSQDDSELEPVSSIQYVYVFSSIALLILVIACINYINLATARASERAKEVGIRKVIGAVKKQLVTQFMGESVVITLLSFIVAYLLIQLALPMFNNITGKQIEPITFFTPVFLLIAFGGLIMIALLAGAYPALAITSFKPVSILKGNFKTSGRGVWLRRTLVVFQFCISIVLMIGTAVIYQQLTFMQNKKLGYNKENTIILPLDRKTEAVYNELKTELLRSGVTSSVARATESPTEIRGGYGLNLEGNDGQGKIVVAMSVDVDFLKTLGMELVEGRDYTEADFKKAEADTLYAFLVNESAVKDLGLTNEEIIGKSASVSGRKGEIIGVVKDFHFASMHTPIVPLVLFNEASQYNYVFVKLNASDITASIASVEEICKRVAPHRPFEYQFLDQQYASLYASEQKLGTLFGIFSTLAIVIACLGLLGLVAFASAQRTKEIGIRKVMGATSASIVVLITRDYTRLVLVAILLGLPLAYYVTDLLLKDFAYKTDLGVWHIVITSFVCIVIAFGTASFQAIKAALINPSETLRNE